MANFKLFIPKLQKIESGYQNNSKDNGNYNSAGLNAGTNLGISARFYEDIIGRPPTVADMKAITKPFAEQLYKKYFWDKAQGDKISNQSIADIIVDHAVNGGESSIGTIVQRILKYDFKKAIGIDGDIGPQTAIAINSVNQQQLFDKIKAARASYYYSLSNSEFTTGWINRLKNFAYEKKALPSVSVA